MPLSGLLTPSFPFVHVKPLLKFGNSFLQVLKHRGYPLKKEWWDQSYENGSWDYLKSLDELPRYSEIMEFVERFKSKGRILDIGCGEGVLQQFLQEVGYSQYLGLDISSQAITKAFKFNNELTDFLCADGSNFVPAQVFDVIIYNESIYYFDHPLKVFKHYLNFLSSGGVCILSNCISHSPHGKRIGTYLKKHYQCIAQTTVKSGETVWEILVIGKNISN